MKGRDIGEISQCKNALKELKCEVEDVIEVDLPFSYIVHHLIVVKKLMFCLQSILEEKKS